MNMVWMLLPFDNGELIWPNAGKGLRNTISLASSYSGVMNDTLAFFHWRLFCSYRTSSVFLPHVLSGVALYAF